MAKNNLLLIGIGIVVVIGLAVLLMPRHHDDTPAQSGLAGGQAGPMSPEAKDEFRKSYLTSSAKSCADTMTKSPNLAEQKITPEMVTAYCECFAEKSVDQFSDDDIAKTSATQQIPPALMATIQDDAKSCAAQYLQPKQ